MLTQRDFEKIQRDTGFDLSLLEKSYHLTRILHAIHTTEELSNRLTLKGGTALAFLYLGLPRLSIDIDFNYTGTLDRERMMTERLSLENAITSLGERLGYRVKMQGSSYILSRHTLRYSTLKLTQDHVRIEVNYLDRLPIGRIVYKEYTTLFPDLPSFPVRTYSLEELSAQKVKACIERTEPRDIYDLSCLADQHLSLEIVRRFMVVYYCMIDPDKRRDVLRLVKAFDVQKLQQELGQFVRARMLPSPDIILSKAEKFLRAVLSFSIEEQRFITTFFDEGSVEPGLLFEEKIDLAQHPVLLFQLEKIKKSAK